MGWLKKAAIWCWDHWERLLKIGVLVVSGAVWAWSAYLSPYLDAYAPLSWVAFGTAGLLGAAVVIALLSWAYSKALVGRRTAEILSRSNINPLDDRFERQELRLIDFYNPEHILHKNKHFRNCRLIGPGMAFLAGCRLDGGGFVNVQAVVAKTPMVGGLTGFENCRFDDCILINVTLVMHENEYAKWPADVKAGVKLIA